ncbi:MAG: TonB-dependent receptor plug domain-containing protein [Candidatus Methylomirabilia bacterium]
MVRAFGIVLVLVMMLVTPGVAQQVKRLAPVVVTATKIPTPQQRLGSSVSVITGEELRVYNYDRVEDALRSLPGVEVERSGSLGKATTVRIRGANPTQIQILIDGMRVKSPTLGQFDFSDLSLDDIERIEIVRGPQSTLHGADAIGGVIHVITKKGAGPPAAAVSFEGGSEQTFRERAAASGAFGRFNFSVSASRTDSRGQIRTFDNDDSDQTAFASRLGFGFPWNASFAATGRYAKSNTDLPVNLFLETRDPDSQQQTEFSLFTLRYDQTVFPWWVVAARMGQMWNNQGFQNGPLPAGDFAFTSQTNTRRREFEILSTWHMAKMNSLTLGLEHRNERGKNRGTFREDTNTRSLFLHDEIRFFDRLFLSAGVRLEDNDVFGSETTPRFSVAYLLKETATKLRGGYGKGFRAPTLNDLFFPDFTGGLCPPFGNANLKPERSQSWEAGVDQKLWKNRLRLEVTYFRNKFRDLITIVNVPPFDFCQQAGNVGKARTEGVEFSTELEPLDWLRFNVNYTFTDTEDESTGRELPRFARHRWNTGVTVTPIPRLSVFAQSYVVSRQFDNIANRDNPGYFRIDLGGTWRLLQRRGILKGLDLTARIQNLTDEEYSEAFGFRALGVNFLAGLQARY